MDAKNMEENKPKKTTDRQYYMFAIRIIGDFGAVIAVPVIIFVILGQYLDGKYEKGILFTVLGFILAALLSAKMIHKKAKIYGKAYQRMVDKDEKLIKEKKQK